jgi:hypothetical protein
MAPRFTKLPKDPEALRVFNKTLEKCGKPLLSRAAQKVIDFSVKEVTIDDRAYNRYTYTVLNDDAHYSDPKFGSELSDLLPRTAIILHDFQSDEVYPTFALRKLAKSSPKILESKADKISKLKISRKVNGKPCSLQLMTLDGIEYVVFVQKMAGVLVPILAFDRLKEFPDELDQFMEVHFCHHEQLKELFEIIYINFEKYIELIRLLGENSVLTGELDDGRHIERPHGSKKFVLHTAMNGLDSIDFSIIEEFCKITGLDCVKYEIINIPSQGSRLHQMWEHLMKYIRGNLNVDSEGWVVLVLDHDDKLILSMKAKKLPYTVLRTLRQMILSGKGNDQITIEDLNGYSDKFRKIFREDHNKSRYFGLTRKGQRRWLEWLEQFNDYALKYRSSDGESFRRLDVSIQTTYGKMNGLGWFVSELCKIGLKPFELEIDDVDLSVNAIINNIFEEDQSELPDGEKPEQNKLSTTPLVPFDETLTSSQVVDFFNSFRTKSKPLICILFRGLPGGGKTHLAHELVKALNQLEIKAMYICQDSLGRNGVIQAIETCRNTETIAVIARCHLGKDDTNIYRGPKGLRDGDRIITFSIGTNDEQTFIRSILGVIHRDSSVKKSGFSYSGNTSGQMLEIHRGLFAKWSNDAYPEEVFGTPYKVESFETNLFDEIDVSGSFDEIRASLVIAGLIDESGEMTLKMSESLVKTETIVNDMITSMVSPSTIWGTWKTGQMSQTNQTTQKDKAVYFCVKFNTDQISDLLKKIDLSGFPETATFKSTSGEFHTTLWFCVKESNDTVKTSSMLTLLGKEFDINVVSWSRDDRNARLDVALPPELLESYKNEAKPHVTLVHTGKASDAGTFEPSQTVPLQAVLRGKVMVAVQGNKMVDTINL